MSSVYILIFLESYAARRVCVTFSKFPTSSRVQVRVYKHVKKIRKNASNHYGNRQWHNFLFTKFSVIEFLLTERRIFSYTRLKQACGRPSSCLFSSSAARNTITQVKYVTFGFSFLILFYFRFQESLSATVCEKYEFYGAISCHNPRKSRQATLD